MLCMERFFNTADSIKLNLHYHLVIFNRDPDTNWDAKIWQRQEQLGALPIGVWGA